MYQNHVSLIGFLGRDAEVKSTRKNSSFVILSLATKRIWKDRELSQYNSETTWHRCIVWGRLGEFASTLTKGGHVQVEGEIRTREYTEKSDGTNASATKRSITEIRAFRVMKLDRSLRGDAQEPAA